MANNLGQPTVIEVVQIVCNECNAVICAGCWLYELLNKEQEKKTQRPAPAADAREERRG